MIKADLHLHTKYSYDSFLDPSLLVKFAYKRGISVVAITDHNSIKGISPAISQARSLPNLYIIPGIEIKTDLGDIIGLFISDMIKSRLYYEVLDEIHNQGGISVLPHPFIKHKINLKELLQVDLIEALNGRIPHPYNSQAFEVATKFNKQIVAGSDAHTFLEIGCVKNIFYDTFSNLEELRSILLNKQRILTGKESNYCMHFFSYGAELFKKRVIPAVV